MDRHVRVIEILVNSDGDRLENRIIKALLPFFGFNVDISSYQTFQPEFGSVKSLPGIRRKILGVGQYRVLGFVEFYRSHGTILPQRHETVKNRPIFVIGREKSRKENDLILEAADR